MAYLNNKIVSEKTKDKMILIGKNVKRLRLRDHKTQLELAIDIFSSISLISELERGMRNNIEIFTLMKLAEVFDVDIKYLFS